jgi:hypothetical protein
MKSSSPYVAVVHLKIGCDWLVCQILDCIIIRNKSPDCINTFRQSCHHLYLSGLTTFSLELFVFLVKDEKAHLFLMSDQPWRASTAFEETSPT